MSGQIVPQLSRQAYRTLGLVLTILFVLLPAVSAGAQDCPPKHIEFLAWGPHGNAGHIVWGNGVPTGEVWRIDTISIATYDGRYHEWMVQKQSNGHFHGVCRSWAAGTPVLACDGHPRVLVAGEFLGARVNANADFGNGHELGLGMALLYTGFSFPAACLERLLLGSVSTMTTTAAADVSGLAESATNAATAADEIAARLRELAASARPPQ